jgi:hypothetical protein
MCKYVYIYNYIYMFINVSHHFPDYNSFPIINSFQGA